MKPFVLFIPEEHSLVRVSRSDAKQKTRIKSQNFCINTWCIKIPRGTFAPFTFAMNNNEGINKVFLIGQVSKTPRWHKSGHDGPLLRFTLQTREIYHQKGRPTEHIEEHLIKLPERCFEQELTLGQFLHIEGKLKTTVFMDEDLIKRYKTEVVAIKITALTKPVLAEQTVSHSE